MAHVFLIFVTSQGKLDEAAPLFERAMDIRVNALGPDDDDVALSLINQAVLLRSQVRAVRQSVVSWREVVVGFIQV